MFSAFPHLGKPEDVIASLHRVLVISGKLLVLHFASHTEINRYHRDVGAAEVSYPLPPVDELASITRRNGFIVNTEQESPDLYYFMATKQR